MKICWLLAAIACLNLSGVSATDEGGFLEHSSDISEVSSGVFQGLTGQIIMNDVFLCYNYTAVLFWNGLDAFKYAFIDGYLATESFGLIIHKSPLVYNQCFRVITDEKFMEFIFTLYNTYTAKVYWNIYLHIFENFSFNMGDAILNMIEAEQNLKGRHFVEFGKNIGNIVAELFYHNPTDNGHWTADMSEIVFNPGHTKKVDSKFY